MVALVAGLAAAGCGAGSVPVVNVEGVVKYGGKPLSHVRVQFLPDPDKGTMGPISSGATDDNGRFHLTCADKRPGAVVGWHRVVITDLSVRLPNTPAHGRFSDDEKAAAAKQRLQLPRVPDKYTSSARTPLTVEVTPDKPQVEFDLTR
jgi:hypothetical protein